MKYASIWRLVLLACLLTACAGLPGGPAAVSPPAAAASPTGQAVIPVTSTQAATPAPAATVVSTTVVSTAVASATAASAAVASTTVVSTAAASATVVSTAAALGAAASPTAPAVTAATALPVCTSPATLTPAVTEGPYFKAGSPERSSLADGLPGTKLTLTGYVLTADCQPVANAKLDFWQADAQGQYDNAGYTLRGHLFTDASGRYRLDTIVPGLYPGRTEHIHVKAQAPNGPVLTTQLFFPGVNQNQSDGIFDQRLLMTIEQTNGGLAGSFNFIIATR